MSDVPVEVREVTDQEWLFCYHVILTGDLVSSLLKAYPSYKDRPKSKLYWQAKQVMSRPAVSAEMQRLRLDLRASQRLTLEQHLHVLAEIREESRQAGQFAAAARCEELRGRAAGLYVEQVLVRNDGVSRDELLARVIAIMAQNPRVAELVGGAVKRVSSSPVPALQAVVEKKTEECPQDRLQE